ncbi:acyltransferase [Microvirga aerophila]|uniref:Transferase n=1 Tax=Microvirga aerophila TaxID=670291 RepID=A0A512BUV9_9HYPH|nr:hypothetical protein [Microvirga aerophila]GEO15763.1 hypothetical protein MAE02_34590 [Microvirga aerophila]
MLRLLIAGAAAIMPQTLKKFLYRTLFGWEIAPGVKIGFSFISARSVQIGENVRIGHLNIFRNVDKIALARDVVIGNCNYFVGASSGTKFYSTKAERVTNTLSIGDESAVTHQHIIDVTGGVHIGSFATIAGYRTTILTHSIDLEENKQSVAPVHIGDYTFIGTNCVLLKGSRLASRCILAAGSVHTSGSTDEGSLYGSGIAKNIKKVEHLAYFSRTQGEVL